MSMIQNSGKTNEIRSLNEIDNSTMQEFLSKLAIWDFYDMLKDEFTSKREVDREKLIINYYKSLMSGIICYLFTFSGSFWLFCVLLFLVCFGSYIISEYSYKLYFC